MKKLLLMTVLLLIPLMLPAQQYLVKFATLAPDGSSWLNIMKEYDQAIRKESGGRVGFRIYAGGVAGDELDVLRKIRLGQFQSAGFTGVGMGKIAPEERILDAPFLFKNHDEVDYILQMFDGELRKAFEDNGFVLLGWAEVGYVYVFTNKPVTKVRDLDGVKMWAWEGDPVAAATFKALAVQPIPLSITDVLTSLQTGLIDGMYTSPYAAVQLQWFTGVKYMLDVPLTNAMGAVLIAKKDFDKYPQDIKDILVRDGAIYFGKLTDQSRKDNEKSLQVLKANKITFTQPASPSDYTQYDEIGRTARQMMAGSLYTSDFLRRIEKALADYRSAHRSSK